MIPANIQKALADAHQLAQSKQFDQALNLINQVGASASGPAVVELLRMRAALLYAKGMNREALDAFQHASNMAPKHPLLAYDFGTILLDFGRYADAYDKLKLAMDHAQHDPRPAYFFGMAAIGLQRFEEAFQGFARANQLDPNQPQTLRHLALCGIKSGHINEAEQAARTFARLNPDPLASQHLLGTVLSHQTDQDKLKEGFQAISQVISKQPKDANARLTAGIILRKLDQLDNAIKFIKSSLELNANDPLAIEMFADLKTILGDKDEAERILDEAISQDPSRVVLRRQRGITLLSMGRPREAMLELAQVCQDQPKDQRAIAFHALAMYASGEQERASNYLGLHKHIVPHDLGTPAPFKHFDEYLNALANDIRTHSENRYEPSGLAARKAWLSGDLLADQTPAIMGFKNMLDACIRQYIGQLTSDADDVFLRNIPKQWQMHVWSTRADHSGFIENHIHEDSWLSGAYYVTLPEGISKHAEQPDGWIEFNQPPQGCGVALSMVERRVMQPVLGQLITFPSYLHHRTRMFSGAGERISVSFDLTPV